MLLSYGLRLATAASMTAASGIAFSRTAGAARCDAAPSFVTVSALTTTGAEKAMAAAKAEAEKNGWKVTIVIADASGTPLLLSRDGASPMTVDIAMGKARTAAISGKESGVFESIVNGGEARPRLALLSAPLLLMEGAVPILVDGVVAGSIGVSGVRSDQDAAVAKAGAAALFA